MVSRYDVAFNTGGPAMDARITTPASIFLWVTLALTASCCIIALVWLHLDPTFNRFQHVIPFIFLAWSVGSKLLTALGYGWIPVPFGSKQVWLARYVAWFAHGLLVVSLLAFTSMSTPQIIIFFFSSCLSVGFSLVAAFTPGQSKWAFFALSVACFAYTCFGLLIYVRSFPFLHPSYRRGYFSGAYYVCGVWSLYFLGWGLAEGSHTVSPTFEIFFYGILDLLSGPVYLMTYLRFLSKFSAQDLAPTAFGNAERGIYGEVQQQEQEQPQAAPQRGHPKGRNQKSGHTDEEEQQEHGLQPASQAGPSRDDPRERGQQPPSGED